MKKIYPRFFGRGKYSNNWHGSDCLHVRIDKPGCNFGIAVGPGYTKKEFGWNEVECDKAVRTGYFMEVPEAEAVLMS